MQSNRFFLRKTDASLGSEADYPLAVVENDVSGLIQSTLGYKPLTVDLSDLSTHHHVYSIQTPKGDFYLKIPKTHSAARTLSLEHGIYTRLLGEVRTGIRIVKFDNQLRDFPFPFLLMTKAAGICLRSVDIDRKDFKDFISSAINKMTEIHRPFTSGSGWGLLDVHAFEKTQDWQGAYASWQEYILSHLQEQLAFAVDHEVITVKESNDIEKSLQSFAREIINPQAVLLHGDLGAHNIFVDEKTYAVTALIDWEDALRGDAFLDVAMFASFYRMEEFIDLIISQYCVTTGLTKEKTWRHFWLYYVRVCFAKAVLRYKYGYDKGKGISTMIPKIQRALMELKSA